MDKITIFLRILVYVINFLIISYKDIFVMRMFKYGSRLFC